MAAEVNGELKLFLQWYVSSGQEPNITRLAHAGLPAGRGRKGGVPKHKRSSTPTVSPDVVVPRPATSQTQPGSSLLSVLHPTVHAGPQFTGDAVNHSCYYTSAASATSRAAGVCCCSCFNCGKHAAFCNSHISVHS